MEDTNCIFPIGWFVDENDQYVKRIPCKSWGCPVCSRVNKKSVLARVELGFDGQRVRFLTLTLRKGCDDKKIMQYWNHFRALLKKHGYKDLMYFWVKEFHKNGARHLHVIINAYIPKKLINHLWYLASKKNGLITHIRGNKGRRKMIMSVAGYMSKYIVKGAESKYFNEFGLDKKEHFYGFSRHKQLSKPSNPSKGIYDIHLKRHINHYRKYTPTWKNDMEVLYGPYFTLWIDTMTYINPEFKWREKEDLESYGYIDDRKRNYSRLTLYW